MLVVFALFLKSSFSQQSLLHAWSLALEHLACFHQTEIIYNYANNLNFKYGITDQSIMLMLYKRAAPPGRNNKKSQSKANIMKPAEDWSLQRNLLSYFHIISLFSTWNQKTIRHCLPCLRMEEHPEELSCKRFIWWIISEHKSVEIKVWKMV